MANKSIKGIMIEIGGDTTKLGDALDKVNKKTKSLQSELKGVNTLLKTDPSNVTLLAQKQDILTKSIENTKEKLETLKEAQKQAQEQFEKGEITEEQFRDLQREVINTKQKLDGLKDEFKEFGSVGAQQVAQVGEKVQEVGGKVTEFGKGFSVVSAGAGAVLAGSISAFKELDSGYDTIITKTGATGEALDELNAVADNIFGSMPTDMDTVSVAVGEINTRFGYTGEKLEGLSRQFIEFAEINGVDLNTSIGTVDKILEQFNLTGEDASGVLDLITKKAQETGIGADTLAKLIQENGSTFKDMGIGVNEAVVLLSQFEANGVNVEVALKGLKKATSEYAEEGISMEEGLSKTIESIKKAKSDTEALGIAQEIFGTKGAGEMAKAIREGRISVEDLTASMSDYAGTVQSTYEGTLDPIDQSTVAMNNLKLAGSELGGALQTTLAPMLTSLVEKLKTLVDKFSNLSPGMQKIITIVLLVVTALGPLIMVIGNLITAVGTILTFAPKVVSAFKLIKTAFTALTGPVGIIITVITALVAVFIYLWNNCEGFREFWINLWESIKETTKKTIDGISKFFTETLPNALSDFWESVKNFFGKIIDFVKDNWQGLLLLIVNPFAGAFKLLYDNCEGFRNFIDNTLEKIKNYFVNLWSGIKNIFSSVGSWFANIFTQAWTNIKNVFSNWVSFFSGLWGKIKSTFSSLGTSIASAISGAIKKGINNVIYVIERTINNAIGLINGAINLINKIPGVSVGKIKQLSLPRLAKGGIVDSPTIAEIGEDGREAVIPLEKNTQWLREVGKELSEQLGGGVANSEMLSKLDGIYERLGRLQVVMNSGALVGEILDDIDAGLGTKQMLSARGV